MLLKRWLLGIIQTLLFYPNQRYLWCIQQENGQESEPMANHEGKHYMCFLPVEETKTMKSILPQNATNVIIESDRRIKPKEPDELLEPLKDQCLYRVSRQLFFFMHSTHNELLVMCMRAWQKKI